jgi:flagellar motor switch protein FliN/FliY
MAEEKDPFEEAMAAMDGGDAEDAGGEQDPFEAALAMAEGGDDSDPFEAALDAAKEDADVVENPVVASNGAAPADPIGGDGVNLDFLMDIKLSVSFEVGRSKMLISDLLSLGQGSVIELHRLVGENLDLLVNGQLLATGEVVVVNEKFGAQITEIIPPKDRISKMGKYGD